MEDRADIDDLKPRPDPSRLTTEQLLREISNLKEKFSDELRHLQEIHNLGLESVARRLEAIATRTLEQKTDTKEALYQALQAAKDAVTLQTESFAMATAKSETGTNKQIEALALAVQRLGEQFDEKIADIKSRLDKLEATKAAEASSAVDHRASTSSNMSQVMAIAAVASILVAIILAAVSALLAK